MSNLEGTPGMRELPVIPSSDVKPAPQLKSLRIRITDQCDMKCRHCMRPAPRRASVFDFARFGPQLIEDLRQLGTNEVVITGGEPTLEMDLTCEIGSRLIDEGIISILFTNAYDLTRDDLQRLLDAGIFTMHVSLDGMETTHDWIRRTPGAFKRTLKNVEAASRMGFQIVARMTLTRSNIGEVERVAAATHSAGVALFKIRPVVPAGRAPRNLCPSAEDLADAVARVMTLSKKQQVTFGSSCFQYVHGLTAQPQAGCFSRHLHVDPRGNILPCGYVKLPLGNLAHDRLPEVFFGARLSALRGLAMPEACTSCQHAPVCSGGCRACAIGWGLRADEPDTYCPIVKQRAPRAYDPGACGAYQITYRGGGVVEIEASLGRGSVILKPHQGRPSPPEAFDGHVEVLPAGGARRADAGYFSIRHIARRGDEAHDSGHPPFVIVEFDGFRFCHLGHLDHALSDADATALWPVDAVFGICDGALGQTRSEEIISDTMTRLGARLFIPLPGQGDTGRAQWGERYWRRSVRRFPNNRARVDLNTLPREPETWLFREPASSGPADRSANVQVGDYS